MSLQTATYLVERNGTHYSVLGSNLNTKLTINDKMIVQRNGVLSLWTVTIGGTQIQDDDIFVCTDDDGITKQVPGSTMKLILPDIP